MLTLKKKLVALFIILMVVVACGEAPSTPDLPDEGAERDAGDVVSVVDDAPTLTPPPLPDVADESAPEAGESDPVEQEVAVEETAVPPPPTEPPPPTPLSEEDAQAVEVLESSLEDELKSESGSELAFGGFETVETTPINMSDGTEVWVSYSVGFRPFEPLQNHFVRLSRQEAEGWVTLGEVELEFPDVVFNESLTAVEENDRLWLEIDSGVGAHGGCWDLLSWDGAELTNSVSHCHSTPSGVGDLVDLNGDGRLDVLLNNTNDYVFCYACGVRDPSYEFRTFNGSAWDTVTLQPMTAGDDYVVALNNAAVELAKAGLWQDAAQSLSQIEGDDPTLIWNQTIVGIYEEAHLEYLSFTPYPLLQAVFYGDYETPLALMNNYAVTDIFAIENNPLLVGTPAEGWLDPLSESLITETEMALTLHPELAEAHFLHGWATFLVDPENPSVLSDIQNAATLAPTNPLFVDSLLYLSGE